MDREHSVNKTSRCWVFFICVLESTLFIKKHPGLFYEDIFNHDYSRRSKRDLRINANNFTVKIPINTVIKIYNKIPLEIKRLPTLRLLK